MLLQDLALSFRMALSWTTGNCCFPADKQKICGQVEQQQVSGRCQSWRPPLVALVAPASFQGAICHLKFWFVCSFVCFCGFSLQRTFFKEKADLKPRPGAGNLPGTSLPKLSDLLIFVFGYVKKNSPTCQVLHCQASPIC